MSFISNLIKDVAPIVATFSTDPVTKAIATGVTVKQQKQEASFQRKLADERNRERANRMAINYNTGFDPVTGQGMPSTTTQNAGQGGFFGGVSDFFGQAGSAIGSIFGSGIPQLFGFN